MKTYDNRVNSSSQSVIVNQIAAYSNGVVYAVDIFERRESLKQFMSRFTRASGEYKRELKVDGASGSEYAFEAGSIQVITQVFTTSRYIYVFRAHGSSLGNPSVGLPMFFGSIRFAQDQAGVPIVDGPGEQPTSEPSSHGDAKILTGKEVTSKAIVVTRPAPSYTDNARRSNATGTVVLRAIFSSSGAVSDIRAISGLPYGLTESAIAAARQIRFIPAIKDGKFVSMYIQLEYTYNRY